MTQPFPFAPPETPRAADPAPSVLAPPAVHQLVVPPRRPPPSAERQGHDDHIEDGAEGTDDREVGGLRRWKVPLELLLLVALSALLLAVFVVLTGAKRGDAEAGRADAEARVAVAESTAREMASVNVDLVDANTALEARVAVLETEASVRAEELSDVQAALDAVPEVVEFDTSELDETIADLQVENEQLAQRTESAETEANALQDALNAPVLEQYVGELLSAAGSAPLDAGQAQCFGAAVIADIGLDGIGAGMNRDRSTETNDAVTASMSSAATQCEIDPALVFGE